MANGQHSFRIFNLISVWCTWNIPLGARHIRCLQVCERQIDFVILREIRVELTKKWKANRTLQNTSWHSNCSPYLPPFRFLPILALSLYIHPFMQCAKWGERVVCKFLAFGCKCQCMFRIVRAFLFASCLVFRLLKMFDRFTPQNAIALIKKNTFTQTKFTRREWAVLNAICYRIIPFTLIYIQFRQTNIHHALCSSVRFDMQFAHTKFLSIFGFVMATIIRFVIITHFCE